MHQFVDLMEKLIQIHVLQNVQVLTPSEMENAKIEGFQIVKEEEEIVSVQIFTLQVR